jgi:TorA maturation chaperone TorD
MPIPGERLRFAAALLAAPGEDAVDELRAFAAHHSWLDAALAEIETLPLQEWQAEHGRLFVGAGTATSCLPFESAQMHGAMCGPATAALTALYRRHGLEADGLPADYLGSMLECAACLADSDDAGPAEVELWRDHLLRWLPDYAQKLAATSRLILYRDLGYEFADLCEESPHG